MIKIKIVYPDQDPLEFTFEKEVISIGSSVEQDIVLPSISGSIQEQHLQLIFSSGSYSIDNLSSDAATLINGQGFANTLLNIGDAITVGDITIEVMDIQAEDSLLSPATYDSETTDLSDADALLSEAEELLNESTQLDTSPQESSSEEQTYEETTQESAKEPSQDAIDETSFSQEKQETSESIDDELDKLLADIELSKEDLEDLKQGQVEHIEDLELDSDLEQIKDLLDDDELAELDLERATESTFDTDLESSDGSAELSDSELEQMLLEIHGDEDSKQEYKDAEEGALLSSLREDPNHSGLSDEFDELAIQFLDEEEPSSKSEAKQTQETPEEMAAQEAAAEKTQEEQEERDYPLGSITQTIEEFGEYDPEKGLALEQEKQQEQKAKAKLFKVDTKQIASIAAVYALSLLILVLGAFFSYTSVTSDNRYSEKLAARGISDYAITLTHRNLFPAQNTSIASHLRSVLPPQYLDSSEIYHTGSFKKAPYTLQTFFNDDKSSFLLLARPESGLIQTLLPKKAIIIDSESHTLRQSSKIHALVDLLQQNESNLSLVDQSALADILDSFETISLSSIDQEEAPQGFAPPPEMAQLYPNIETYVYNAPRYYRLQSKIIDAINSFELSSDMVNDYQALSKDLAKLAKLKNATLYFSSSTDEALKAFALIRTFFKTKNIPVGHISFDTNNGMISDANMITSDQVSEQQRKAVTTLFEEFENFRKEKVATLEKIGVKTQGALSNYSLDTHPIYTQVQTAIGKREKALATAGEEIKQFLENNQKGLNTESEETPVELTENYKLLDRKAKKILADDLAEIFESQVLANSKENLPIFISAIEENNLTSVLPKSINERIDFIKQKRTSKKDLDYLIQAIDASKTFDELKTHAQSIEKILNPDYFDQASQFMRLKNRFKQALLSKVKEFVLDNKHYQTNNQLKREDRNTLEFVLKTADISESEETRFYLNEFDQLLEQFYSLPDKETLAKLEQSNEQIAANLKNDVFLSETQKQLIQEQTKDTRAQVESQEHQVLEVQDQINKVPLKTYHAATPTAQKDINSRVGQQILVKESLNTPSNDRDDQLLQALNLILEGTKNNRMLWADILEIRKLLAQTPEQEIQDIIGSDLGFDPKKAPLTSTIRKLSKKYIEEKKKLAALATDKNRYFTSRSLFANTQRQTLEKIIDLSQEVQKLSYHFQQTIDNYISALERFSLDYHKAKEEGFFVKDSQYHAVMLSRLSLKLKRFKKLRDAITPVVQQISVAAASHEELAQAELNELGAKVVVDLDSVNALTQKDNEIAYPDLTSRNIAKQVHELLVIKVNPYR